MNDKMSIRIKTISENEGLIIVKYDDPEYYETTPEQKEALEGFFEVDFFRATKEVINGQLVITIPTTKEKAIEFDAVMKLIQQQTGIFFLSDN
jgi:hypothetical protein